MTGRPGDAPSRPQEQCPAAGPASAQAMASDAYAPTAPPRTPGATSTPAGAEQRNDGYGVTWPRVLHSEWAKLWSLRSTWISLIATCVVTVVLGMAVAGTYESGSADSDVGPVELTLLGTQFGQIMIAVLGVLVTAGEYATGMIRATFAAVPRRLPVLWAKATVFGAVAFAVMLVTVFLTFPLAQGFLSGTDMEAGLGDPGVVRALCGAAAGIALSGVLCLGFGALLRGVPAAIGAYIGAVLVLPEVAGLLPYGAVDDITAYLPSKATYALMATHHGPDLLAPGPALLAMGCWVAVTLAAAALLIKRRDV